MDATKECASLSSFSTLTMGEWIVRISQKVELGAVRRADLENHFTARAQSSQYSCSAEYPLFDGQSTTLRSTLFTFTNRNLRFSYSLFLYFWIVSALAVDSCRLAREVSLYLLKKTAQTLVLGTRWDETLGKSKWLQIAVKVSEVKAGAERSTWGLYSQCVGEEMPKSAYTTIIFSSPSKWNFHAALSTPQALIRDSALLHPSQRAFPYYFKT